MDNARWIVQAAFVNKAGWRVIEPYDIFDLKADADAGVAVCREDLESQGMRNISVSVLADA